MENKCCDCEHLNRNDERKDWFSSKITYRCKECWNYKSLDDKACSNFKDKTNNNGYTPSRCYITTIVCDILGYEDNCELLCILRNFRDNYLKINPNYIPLLIEYDNIGPKISEEIKAEKNNYGFCLGIMTYFLIPCANAIKNEDIEEAINIYQNMVMYLNDEFSLPNITINLNNNYDIETLGKGRIRQIKTSEMY